jgi:hypothetical protein
VVLRLVYSIETNSGSIITLGFANIQKKSNQNNIGSFFLVCSGKCDLNFKEVLFWEPLGMFKPAAISLTVAIVFRVVKNNAMQN